MNMPRWKFGVRMLFVVFSTTGVGNLSSTTGQSRSESPARDRQERGVSAAVQTDAHGCTKRFDRFRNRNTVTIEPRTVYHAGGEELKVGASAVVEGDKGGGSTPSEIDVLFDSIANRLRYGNSAEVHFIVDGKRTEGGVAYKSGGFSMRQVNEKLRLTLPASRFLEIIAGREVEMQIGETEVTLRREDLEHLRDFAVCAGLRARQ